MTDDQPVQLRWGLHGEVEAIAQALIREGIDTSFEELMGITGSAFRTHFFRLTDNPGMRLGPDPDNPNVIWGPRYAWSSLRHNNFGHFESASYFYGGDMVIREGLPWDSLWKLIRFELDAERPLALYNLPGQDPWRPVLIRRYALSSAPLSLSLPGLDPEVSFTPRDGTPTNLGALLVRLGELKPYRPSDNVRKREVLRWALRHGVSRRELVYESERFYAVGVAAFDALTEFLTVGVAEELDNPILHTSDEAAVDIGRFLAAIAEQWTEARRCGAWFCRAWADELTATAPDPDDPPMPAPEALRLLADDVARVSEELGRLAAEFSPALLDADAARELASDAERLKRSARIVTAAQSLERVWLQRLSEIFAQDS